MPNNSDIIYLRMLLAEPNEPGGAPAQPGQTLVGSLFSDDQLNLLIERTALISRAAEVGWKAKAAYLQPLVDVDESGVSRKLSQMYKNAMTMAQQFKITADEEWLAMQGAVRTVGIGAAPWGVQWSRYPNSIFGSMIIGDVSRAGSGGSVFFIEVPVDPNLLNEKLADANDTVDAAVLEPIAMQVPTDRRMALFTEVGRTFSYTLNYLDPTTQDVVDITGWVASIIIRTAPGGIELMQQDLATDDSNCAFDLTIPADVTAGFNFVQGDYEIVVTDVMANSISLVTGTFYVNQGDA